MDLLGSILNAMDKQAPPRISEKEKERRKQQKAQHEKQRVEEQKKINAFRVKTEEVVNAFVKDDSKLSLAFPPMNNTYRSIVHDVAEVAGLPSYSFGDEDITRHVQIFKRESAPNEKELEEMRRTDVWDLKAAREIVLKREQELNQKEKDDNARDLKRKAEVVLPSTYIDKYTHLIGKEAALDAAKITVTNKQYGFVPSENKKDQRSIEQTLNELRAKKKQKLSHGESASSSQE